MKKAPILILGAGSDIGLAIAAVYAAEGHPVQLAGRAPDRLEEDSTNLALRHRVEVTTHACDVTDPDAAEGFFDALPATPGIVVSAVGLMGDPSEAIGDPRRGRDLTEANYLGPAVYLEEAARRLVARGEPGVIVGISSVAGDRGRAVNYWYGAAKAGFTAFLSGLRQRLVRTDVQVITVKPGFVATRMTEGMDLSPALTAQPQDIAALVRRAHAKGRYVVTPFKWWAIMTIIRAIPEPIFRKLRF